MMNLNRRRPISQMCHNLRKLLRLSILHMLLHGIPTNRDPEQFTCSFFPILTQPRMRYFFNSKSTRNASQFCRSLECAVAELFPVGGVGGGGARGEIQRYAFGDGGLDGGVGGG